MPYLTPKDVASIGVFTALWIVLHLTIGPLGFKILSLPVLCDLSAYFTLILVAWATNKFGTATLTGILGSLAVFLLRGALHIWGFAASAIIFDLILLTIRHKIDSSIRSLTALAVATITAAYTAGVLIGTVFTTGKPVEWALTFWGGWHAIGGVIALILTIPIIGTLERAGVKTLAKTS